MKKKIGLISLSLLLVFVVASCNNQETGDLTIFANGEDFIREGFETKDGWQITFDSATIHVGDVSAYQTSPAYDPHEGALTTSEVEVSLADDYVVDLAAGDENADPILVGTIEDVPTGHYNAIGWQLIDSDDVAPIVLKGLATKDSQEISFTLTFPALHDYTCGEFVGDVRKGFVETDAAGDLEMTFHFDHIFGDAELDSADELNQGAIGFEPFAALAEDGQLDLVVDETVAFEDGVYDTFYTALTSLGHVGEGHCYFATAE